MMRYAYPVENLQLGHRLGLNEKAIRRLRDPLHKSHVGALENALRALGTHLERVVVNGCRVSGFDERLSLSDRLPLVGTGHGQCICFKPLRWVQRLLENMG
jgi:hypothetical protein